MLTTSKQMIMDAQKGGYAIGCFNTSDIEITKAIVAAATKLKAPVMVATSEKAIDYAGLEVLSASIIAEAKKASVPVALHLDHGKSLEMVDNCLKAGYTSVMIDASSYELSENIALTYQAAIRAHTNDIPCEGELGALGKVGSKESHFTNAEDVNQFVKKTEVDFLAISVGSMHGAGSVAQEKLNIDLIKKIRAFTDVPLVLHGGSGVAELEIRQAIAAGIAKINIDTDIRNEFTSELREALKTCPDEKDPRMIMQKAIDAVQKLVEDNADDIDNYYLLFWQNTKDGIVFKDFDFVTSFEYSISKDKPLAILNLFEIKEKGGKDYKHYPVIHNIFDFEQQIMKPFIQSKYLRVDYFGDLNKDDYTKLDLTFCSLSRYRKAIYDYVYKSQRNTIDGHIFDEMVFNAIKDDIKNNNDYGIKEKLNIWYSLYEYFNTKNKINMVNKLKDYQNFVAAILADDTLTDITDEKFAFAAGQVINYILSKSKSADKSYNLLEPYLQQSKCVEFKRAIANDFGRYKHENFSKNFEKVAAFVLSYETSANLKQLLPQILSGVFSKNQLFSTNISK